MLTTILFWIIFGGLTGWIASLIVNRGSEGLLGNIIIGIVGSLLGGGLFQLLGGTGITGFNIYSVLVGILGSVILLVLLNMFTKGKVVT